MFKSSKGHFDFSLLFMFLGCGLVKGCRFQDCTWSWFSMLLSLTLNLSVGQPCGRRTSLLAGVSSGVLQWGSVVA